MFQCTDLETLWTCSLKKSLMVNPIFNPDHLVVSSVLDMSGVGASKMLSISHNFKNIDHNAFASDVKSKLDLVLLDSYS